MLTAGGVIGTVRVLTDDELRLEVGPGVEMRLLRAAVTRRLDDAADAGTEVEPPADVDDAGPEQER